MGPATARENPRPEPDSVARWKVAFWANRLRGDACGGPSSNAAQRRSSEATGRRRLPDARRGGRGHGLSSRSSSSLPRTSFPAFATSNGGEQIDSNLASRTPQEPRIPRTHFFWYLIDSLLVSNLYFMYSHLCSVYLTVDTCDRFAWG